MKMIIAIVQSKDSNRLRKAFNKADIHVTQLSTTGGFLREGNATFLIGIEDDRVQEVLSVIKRMLNHVNNTLHRKCIWMLKAVRHFLST